MRRLASMDPSMSKGEGTAVFRGVYDQFGNASEHTVNTFMFSLFRFTSGGQTVTL